MIDNKTLVFDFGGVFLTLNESATRQAFAGMGFVEENQAITKAIENFQRGAISPEEFRAVFKKEAPKVLEDAEIDAAWNSMIGEIPQERLLFLMDLAKSHELYLLSNIDAIHMDYIKANVVGFDVFEDQFEALHYSHEVGYRKPDAEIYLDLLQQNGLSAEDCIFIDDLEVNTQAAAEYGFNTWHLDLSQHTVLDFPKAYQPSLS